MSKQETYRSLDGAVTLFDVDGSSVQLQMLCGNGLEHLGAPRVQGIFILAADIGDLEQDQWSLVQ